MPSFTLKCFANNEIVWGSTEVVAPSRSYGDKAAQRDSEYIARMAANSQREVVQGYSGAAIVSPNPKDCFIIRRDDIPGYRQSIQRSLDFFSDFQRAKIRQNKKKYDTDNRPSIFGRSARRRLLEGAFVSQEWGTEGDKGYFSTFTLPGSTKDAVRTMARYSGYIVNRLLQPFRRYVGESIYFYVWEWQKRGALHLHLFYKLDNPEDAASFAIKLDGVWWRALERVGGLSNTDLFTSAKTGKRVSGRYWQSRHVPLRYGNAGFYMAKYMGKTGGSKGFGEVNSVRKDRFYPARWSGMSRNLRRMIDERRIAITVYGITDKECREISLRFTEALAARGLSPVYSHRFELRPLKQFPEFIMSTGERTGVYVPDGQGSIARECAVEILGDLIAECSNAVVQYKYGRPSFLPESCIASMQ